ncbi:hypothetical protein HQN89_10730 [Paenibacillus frigoriresistens]|nr:hypothetical protein [Paenibacillus frigoriresistens]
MLGQGPLITNNWLIGCVHLISEEIKAVSSQKSNGEYIGGEVAKRISYFLEEITEFAAADELEDQVDALIDLIYFAIGTFTLMGVKPEAIFDIVHAANMGKVGPDGRVIRNDQGKIQKPEGWQDNFAPENRIRAEIERQTSTATCPVCKGESKKVFGLECPVCM